MSSLWESTIAANPVLARWLTVHRAKLRVSRLPRGAWPIVAGSVARAVASGGHPLLVLVSSPDRFAEELRAWLGGGLAVHVFAEIQVSFLDRPPAFDDAVNRRLEALAALGGSYEPTGVIVSSRRAMTRMTISPRDLAEASLELVPRAGPDPASVARRLIELGYSREPLVEEPGQFSLRGGILDVFPAGADAPSRAERLGDMI
jgi:transcription-repair coupling factor (superfamily II helicase)